MTEAEWLRCIEPQKMADFPGERPWGSGRKSRLFVCACVRRVWHLLNNRCYRLAVEMAEQAADGLITDEAIEDAWMRWIDEDDDFGNGGEAGIAALAATGVSVRWDWEDAHRYAVAAVAGNVPYSPNLAAPPVVTELQAQADLFRDIFGNPFRPVAVNPALQTPTVVSLADAAYDNRTLPAGTLEGDRLAILADALEEAGCDSADILNHLRQPGVHVRGCWVVDLIVGKQ